MASIQAFGSELEVKRLTDMNRPIYSINGNQNGAKNAEEPITGPKKPSVVRSKTLRGRDRCVRLTSVDRK